MSDAERDKHAEWYCKTVIKMQHWRESRSFKCFVAGWNARDKEVAELKAIIEKYRNVYKPVDEP